MAVAPTGARRAGTGLLACAALLVLSTALPWLTARWSDHPDETFSGWGLAADRHGHLFYDQAGPWFGWSVRHWVDGGVEPVAGPALFALVAAVIAACGVGVLVASRRADEPAPRALCAPCGFFSIAAGGTSAALVLWNLGTWAQGWTHVDTRFGVITALAVSIAVIALGAWLTWRTAGEVEPEISASVFAVIGLLAAVSLVGTAVVRRAVVWADSLTGADEIGLVLTSVALACTLAFAFTSFTTARRRGRRGVGATIVAGLTAALPLLYFGG